MNLLGFPIRPVGTVTDRDSPMYRIKNNADLNNINNKRFIKVSTEMNRNFHLKNRDVNNIFHKKLERLTLVFPSAKYSTPEISESLYSGFKNKTCLKILTIAGYKNPILFTPKIYKIPIISDCSRTLKFIWFRHLKFNNKEVEDISKTLNFCNNLELVWFVDSGSIISNYKFWLNFPLNVGIEFTPETLTLKSYIFWWDYLRRCPKVNKKSEFTFSGVKNQYFKKNSSNLVVSSIISKTSMSKISPKMIKFLSSDLKIILNRIEMESKEDKHLQYSDTDSRPIPKF